MIALDPLIEFMAPLRDPAAAIPDILGREIYTISALNSAAPLIGSGLNPNFVTAYVWRNNTHNPPDITISCPISLAGGHIQGVFSTYLVPVSPVPPNVNQATMSAVQVPAAVSAAATYIITPVFSGCVFGLYQKQGRLYLTHIRPTGGPQAPFGAQQLANRLAEPPPQSANAPALTVTAQDGHGSSVNLQSGDLQTVFARSGDSHLFQLKKRRNHDNRPVLMPYGDGNGTVIAAKDSHDNWRIFFQFTDINRSHIVQYGQLYPEPRTFHAI